MTSTALSLMALGDLPKVKCPGHLELSDPRALTSRVVILPLHFPDEHIAHAEWWWTGEAENQEKGFSLSSPRGPHWRGASRALWIEDAFQVMTMCSQVRLVESYSLIHAFPPTNIYRRPAMC